MVGRVWSGRYRSWMSRCRKDDLPAAIGPNTIILQCFTECEHVTRVMKSSHHRNMITFGISRIWQI